MGVISCAQASRLQPFLAAARIDAVELFRSDDDGVTWVGPQRVTNRNEINAQLLRLKDGRLLMSYGNRVANPRHALQGEEESARLIGRRQVSTRTTSGV